MFSNCCLKSTESLLLMHRWSNLSNEILLKNSQRNKQKQQDVKLLFVHFMQAWITVSNSSAPVRVRGTNSTRVVLPSKFYETALSHLRFGSGQPEDNPFSVVSKLLHIGLKFEDAWWSTSIFSDLCHINMLIFAMIRFSVSMSSQGGSGLGMAPLDPRCRHHRILLFYLRGLLWGIPFWGSQFWTTRTYIYIYIYIYTYISICLGLVFIQGRLIEATLKIPTAMAPIVPISGRVTIKPPLEISYLHGNETMNVHSETISETYFFMVPTLLFDWIIEYHWNPQSSLVTSY